MAVTPEFYYSWDLSALQTEVDALNAEITRQRTAGSAFGMQGRSRQGVAYETLIAERNAVQQAIAYKNGSFMTDQVANLSSDPL